MVRAQAPGPITVFNPAAAIPEMSSFPAPPPLPVTSAPISNEIPAVPIQQTEVVMQQPRHQVEVPIEDEMEVKNEVEEDEELVEKFETESFGFEVPDDDVVDVEKATEDVGVDRDGDIPTPLQDENDVDEELQVQQVGIDCFQDPTRETKFT